MIERSVDSAIFGILCVLDGVRITSDGTNRCRFELRYVDEDVDILNPPDERMLHDLY